MPETGFITAKIMSGVGGLLGGMTLMAFMKPQSILDATLRGGISTGTGIIFTMPILEWLGINATVDMIIMFAFITGFLAWGVLSLIAQIFINAQKKDQDIIDVVNKSRSGSDKK